MRYRLELSRATGKIRIKERQTFADYGLPTAPTKTLITHKHYIEWQIGYDSICEKGETAHFIGANGKNKQIYELSEILLTAIKEKMLTCTEISDLLELISQNKSLIDESENISRTNFVNHEIGRVEFLKSSVSYPLLVHKFATQDSICEIIVREKQYAVGVMPMLYFCVPMSVLEDEKGNQNFVGRTIASKECGYLQIDKNNIAIFVQMFRIFGLLSNAHKHDCMEILKYILKITEPKR